VSVCESCGRAKPGPKPGFRDQALIAEWHEIIEFARHRRKASLSRLCRWFIAERQPKLRFGDAERAAESLRNRLHRARKLLRK
jgi:hypothetical protein